MACGKVEFVWAKQFQFMAAEGEGEREILCVCVCVRERERDEVKSESILISLGVFVPQKEEDLCRPLGKKERKK